MRFIFAGTSLVMRTPKLWRFIIQPLLTALTIFVSLAVLSYWLIVPRIAELLRHPFGRDHSPAENAGTTLMANALFISLFVVTSGSLYLLLVSISSSTQWGRLSMEVELVTTGRRIEAKLSAGALLSDTVARGFHALFVTSLSLCCGWTLFGLPSILLAGYLGCHDYTAAAYLRRGVIFREQRELVKRLPAEMSFALLGGLLTLLPVVNVLMLPCLVTAGTLMVIESERVSATKRDAPSPERPLL